MNTTTDAPQATVFSSADQLIDHLGSLGSHSSSERRDSAPPYTELDHGLQTAFLLAEQYTDDVELQVAGLIHDLAHPWDGPGQPFHGGLGATAVRTLLGDRVADLVESHVPAKRYLATVRPEYRSILSSGSIRTLDAQGGDMSPAEVEAFEQRSDLEWAIALRIADDGAKIPGAVVPPLEYWSPIIGTLSIR